MILASATWSTLRPPCPICLLHQRPSETLRRIIYCACLMTSLCGAGNLLGGWAALAVLMETSGGNTHILYTEGFQGSADSCRMCVCVCVCVNCLFFKHNLSNALCGNCAAACMHAFLRGIYLFLPRIKCEAECCRDSVPVTMWATLVCPSYPAALDSRGARSQFSECFCWSLGFFLQKPFSSHRSKQHQLWDLSWVLTRSTGILY